MSAKRPKNASDFGPAKDRVCVRMGMAVPMPDGTLRYDWKQLYKAWLIDPCQSAREFLEKYQVPYFQAMRTGYFSAAKKRAEKQRVLITERRQWLRRAIAQSGLDPENEAQTQISMLESGMKLSKLLLSYANGIMEKYIDGDPVPNLAIPIATAKGIAQIMRDCVYAQRQINEMIKLMPKSDTDREIIEPEIVAPPALPAPAAEPAQGPPHTDKIQRG